MLDPSLYWSTFSLQPGKGDICQYPQHIGKNSTFNKLLKETIPCWTIAVDGQVLSNTQDHLKANAFNGSYNFKERFLPKSKSIKFLQALQQPLLLTQLLKAMFETFHKGNMHYKVIFIFKSMYHDEFIQKQEWLAPKALKDVKDCCLESNSCSYCVIYRGCKSTKITIKTQGSNKYWKRQIMYEHTFKL